MFPSTDKAQKATLTELTRDAFRKENSMVTMYKKFDDSLLHYGPSFLTYHNVNQFKVNQASSETFAMLKARIPEMLQSFTSVVSNKSPITSQAISN